MGDCGSGTWGKIKTTASTVYVDQSHKGAGSKGTSSEPYKSISMALKYATVGDHIAVAAGSYQEQVIIQRKVTLEGRCAQMVTINPGAQDPAVTLKNWANGAVLRGVTVTGPDTGIRVEGVAVILEGVAVQGCGGRGVKLPFSTPVSSLTLRDSLIAGNRGQGIHLRGATVTLERVVVRDTREHASDNSSGVGIEVGAGVGTNTPSHLTVRDSIIAGNRTDGLVVVNSTAALERTVVRDTHEQASNNRSGHGIGTGSISSQHPRTELTVTDSIIAGNHSVGILLYSSKATLERTVVRDTHERASDKLLGQGITALSSTGDSRPAELTLRHCLVIRNRAHGIQLFSAKATVDRTMVRDTRELLDNGKLGRGIELNIDSKLGTSSELLLQDSLVAGNRHTGIILYGSKATVERTVVRDTQERASDNTGGVGIAAVTALDKPIQSTLTVRDSLVVNNRSVGIDLVDAGAMVERTVVRDTRTRLSDKEGGRGVEAQGKSAGASPALVLRDCVVAGNRSVNVALFSVKGTLERTMVGNIQQPAQGSTNGKGIYAGVSKHQRRGSELYMLHSLVAGSHSAGVSLGGSRATVVRSVVHDTIKDARGLYGDGLAIGYQSKLEMRDSAVERSARAGMLFIAAEGSVHGSLLRSNVFPIDLEEDAKVAVGQDNHLLDNQINKVTTGQGLKTVEVPQAPEL